MTMMQKVFGFEGRLRRRDYWLINIGFTVIIVVITLVSFAIFGDYEKGSGPTRVVQYVLYIPQLWIGIALALKRCHDRNKGGGWVVFFWLVPVVGWIWGFIELGFLDGTQGRNRYGKSPKGIGGETDSKLAEIFA
ncbi:DUF805 domain-containing protein [Caulobacter sp. DWR3-1-2]|uniref:DUF805 domain-containing protein n=1 Tax=Caulobacter sp. DWR3-1-2 TaxID=2804647 RepID=UPI003CF6897D